jgi:sugar O-acyltransferase (sialic acid O-acetyltransferase NeuD family)
MPEVRKPTLYLCGAGNAEGVRLALTTNRIFGRWDRIVLLDDDASKHGTTILGVEIVGGFGVLEGLRPDDAELVNMVARTTPRRWRVHQKLRGSNLPFASLIHPTVERDGADVGESVVVYQHATLGPLTTLGMDSVVFMGAVVGHGSRLGRGCVLAPNAVINARVEVGEGVYVGTNATVLPEATVGAWATIAAGSSVMIDVPPGATVMGVPAKVIIKRNAEAEELFAAPATDARSALIQPAYQTS